MISKIDILKSILLGFFYLLFPIFAYFSIFILYSLYYHHAYILYLNLTIGSLIFSLWFYVGIHQIDKINFSNSRENEQNNFMSERQNNNLDNVVIEIESE